LKSDFQTTKHSLKRNNHLSLDASDSFGQGPCEGSVRGCSMSAGCSSCDSGLVQTEIQNFLSTLTQFDDKLAF